MVHVATGLSTAILDKFEAERGTPIMSYSLDRLIMILIPLLAILVPLAVMFSKGRTTAPGRRVFDLFLCVGTLTIVTVLGFYFCCFVGQGIINTKLDNIHTAQQEMSNAILKLVSESAALQGPDENLPEALQLDSNPAPGFLPAVLAGIRNVETETEYAPAEFKKGAVGLRFSEDLGTDKVTVRAMKTGLIKWIRPDPETDPADRFHIVLAHEDGYESYYGLIAILSPALADEDLEKLVRRRVEQGAILGWAVKGSPFSVRLGLRKDGEVRNPLKAIPGYQYLPQVTAKKD